LGVPSVVRDSVTGYPWSEEVLHGERFETVLAAAQMGTEWAIGALYQEFNPRILRYLKALGVASPNEVATQVWRELASSLGRFEGDLRALRRWVFAVARRKRLESRPGGSGVALDLAPDGAPMDIFSLEFDEEPAVPSGTGESLARISDLPQDEAEVLLFRVLGELTSLEIAEILGTRPAAVRTLEQQGLDRLRGAPVLAFVPRTDSEAS
jgi:RNA polymerase sigma-70 factor (ECF subfamily)